MKNKLNSTNYALDSQSGVSEADLDKALAEAGIDPLAVSQEIATEKTANDTAMIKRVEQAEAQFQTKKAGYDILTGISTGFRDIGKNIYNGAIDVLDAADDYAATKGIGRGDLFSQEQKWSDPEGAAAKAQMGASGKVANAVTQFAAPVVASIATGGGVAAGVAVDAAYSFLAIDPKEARLSDHLKGTAVEEVPIVSDMVSALQTKPDDTTLMSRFKNAVEATGIGAAVGGMLWGASKVYSGVKTMRNPKTIEAADRTLRKAEKAVSAAEEQALQQSDVAVSASKESGAMPIIDNGVAPTAPNTGATAKPVIDVTEKEVKDTAEQLDLFEQEWAKLGSDAPPAVVSKEDGLVRVNLADDNLLEKMQEISEINPNVLRTPMTTEETTQAARILADDPDVITRIANYNQEAGVLTDKETLVVRHMLSRGEEDLIEAAKNVDFSSPASIANWGRKIQGYQRITDIIQGSASAKGATLRAEKIVGSLLDVDPKEALKTIGTKGRSKMINDLIESYGGREALEEIQKNVTFLEEFHKIAQMPDASFRAIGDEVAQTSKVYGFQQGLTKYLLNSMLSSPKTWARAAFGSAFTSTKSVADNYIAAMIPNGDVALREANAHMVGFMSGLLDGFRTMGQTFKTGKPVRTMKAEYLSAMPENGILGATLEEKARDGIAVGVSNSGLAVAADIADKAVTLPTRVLMSLDAYWGTVNTKAYKYREAARLMSNNPRYSWDQAIESVSRNKEISMQAELFASTNNFSKELTGIAAKLDGAVEATAQKYSPLIRVAVPFFKTSVNSVEYVIKNSPMAIAAPGVRHAIQMGGREGAEATAKILSGSAIMGSVAYLAQQGMVKTDDSFNPNLKGIEYGVKGSSIPQGPAIKISDDQWVSVKGLEPLATMINVASNLSKANGYLDEEQYNEAMVSGVAALVDVFSPEMLVDNVTTLTKVIGGDQDALATYGQNLTNSIVPNLVSGVAREIDPVSRVTKSQESGIAGWSETLKAKLQNRVPYFSKDLPAHRNIFGQKIKMPDGLGPDIISPFSTSSGKGLPMKQALERINLYAQSMQDAGDVAPSLSVRLPSRELDVPGSGGATITLDNYDYELLQIASAGIHPATGQLLDSRGDLYDQWHDILSAHKFYDKAPDTMPRSEYNLMVAEMQGVYTRMQKQGRAVVQTIPQVEHKLLRAREAYESRRGQE